MPQLVIGIPGPWQSRAEILAAVMNGTSETASPRFMALGGVIMDSRTQNSFGFEVYEPDPNLAKAFELAGQGRFSEDELQLINSHRHTVYIVCGEPFQSPSLTDLSAARSLLELGMLMLNAGGFAVKVESSGIAHTADRWRHYANAGTTLAAYDAFVTLIGSDDFNYTCGMHTFGKPDVSLTPRIPVNEAPFILNAFNQYQILEAPHLSDGNYFTTALGEPVFKITHCEYGYEDGDILNNPFGRWHLGLNDSTGLEPEAKYQLGRPPLFMALASNDPEVLQSVEDARKSLPWFLRNFQSPYEYGSYLVKTRIVDGEESAYIWARLEEVKDDALVARLFEMPAEFANYQAGMALEIQKEEVYDWSINRNGTLIGGFSRRIQRAHTPRNELHQFDLFSGNIAFVPVSEVLREPGG